MASSKVECRTQAEFEAALAAGDEPVVRSGGWSAYGSATVWAYDLATVWASGSATVWAYGSATVRASGSATVRAYDLATVRATPLVPVHAHGPHVTITGGIPVSARHITNPKAWCEFHGLDVARGKVTVYKAVEADWQGGHKHGGITYAPGGKPEAPDWRKDRGCGGGLHFVARPWEGDIYLSGAPAHYVACVVRVSEMAVIDIGKVKARRVVEPIVECDLDGNPIQEEGE